MFPNSAFFNFAEVGNIRLRLFGCSRIRPSSILPKSETSDFGYSGVPEFGHRQFAQVGNIRLARLHAGYARWHWRRRDGKGRLYERRLARSPGATHEEGGTGNLTLTGCQRHSGFISDGLFNATLRINSLVLIHIGRAHHALAHHIE